MVRYTGRSGSQITKNSTNQPGLELSGSANGVGSRFRNVGQRVTDNVKVCGPVYRHGVIWSTNTKKNSICLPPASKCQGIAGGIGRINAPRFSCTKSFVQQLGTKQVPQTGPIIGGSGGLGPRWTRVPNFEKPAGTCDEGDYTTIFYTQEQQKRLNVDRNGEPTDSPDEQGVQPGGFRT